MSTARRVTSEKDPAPLASRAAQAFAGANVPLAALAIAADWPTPLGASDEGASARETFASKGTALSGPLPPVAVTAMLGFLARREDRWGTAAVASIGIVGVLISINATRQLFAEPTGATPRTVLATGGALFAGFGLAFVVTAVRDLVARQGAAFPR